MMKLLFYTITLLIVALGFSTLRVAAQVDPSGSWEFEKSTSPFLSAKSFRNSVVIKQSTTDISITSKMHAEHHDKKSGTSRTLFDDESTMTYFPNGRGEVNTAANGNNIFSKTEWKGDKLRTTFFSGPIEEKKKETLGTVEIGLSKDGRQLFMAKKGKPGDGIPYGAEEYARQGDAMAVLLIKGSLANRKDTFRLVSK